MPVIRHKEINDYQLINQFDLKDSNKMEKINKLKKFIFY